MATKLPGMHAEGFGILGKICRAGTFFKVDIHVTERKLRKHARKYATLSPPPPTSLKQIPESGKISYSLSRALNSCYIIQKAYASKHFLMLDCSMTSFYAVSALSNHVESRPQSSTPSPPPPGLRRSKDRLITFGFCCVVYYPTFHYWFVIIY